MSRATTRSLPSSWTASWLVPRSTISPRWRQAPARARPAHTTASTRPRRRRRRQELGLTQEELALRSDLHQRWISNVENGHRNPSYSSLRRLAAGLALRASELIALAEDCGYAATGRTRPRVSLPPSPIDTDEFGIEKQWVYGVLVTRLCCCRRISGRICGMSDRLSDISGGLLAQRCQGLGIVGNRSRLLGPLGDTRESGAALRCCAERKLVVGERSRKLRRLQVEAVRLDQKLAIPEQNWNGARVVRRAIVSCCFDRCQESPSVELLGYIGDDRLEQLDKLDWRPVRLETVAADACEHRVSRAREQHAPDVAPKQICLGDRNDLQRARIKVNGPDLRQQIRMHHEIFALHRDALIVAHVPAERDESLRAVGPAIGLR